MLKLQHCLKGAALIFVFTLLAFAQNTPAKLSVVIGEHKIKFTPLGQYQELRLEVHNNVGELIYDSGALAEADLNWDLRDSNGQPLAPGLYAYTVSIKAPDAAEPHKHQGHLIVEKGGERLWLTTKGDGAAGAEVAGDELLVARDSERTTAGAGYGAAGRTLAERGAQQRDAQGRSLADEKNGVTQENAQSAPRLSGTGTTNQIVKWLNGPSRVLGDSTITETANGSVGIGTTVPDTKFEVQDGDVQIEKSGSPALFLFSRGGGTQRYSLRATNDLDRAGGRNFIIRNESQGRDELTITPFGNVGIGTTAPQARLDVRGNVKLGNSGELFATSGGENLRIVRGVIDQDGNIIVGSGFQIVGSNGEFRIVFTTPFSAPPAVTATAHLDTAGGGTVAMTKGVLGTFADITLCRESSSAVCSPRKGAFHFIAIGPR